MRLVVRSVSVTIAIAFGLFVASLTANPAQADAASSLSSGFFFLFGGHLPTHLFIAPVSITGSLTERFHGDPRAGCAARGTCGYAGATYWTAPRRGEVFLEEFRTGSRRSYTASLGIGNEFGQTAIASSRVRRLGSTGSCSDASPSTGFSLPVHSGQLILDIPGSGTLTTRCAGPLGGDFAPPSTSPRVSIAALLRHAANADLTGVTSFAGGGYAGTVSSTLHFHFGRAKVTPFNNSSGGPTKTIRERVVSVTYRAQLTGEVTLGVNGVKDPIACALLDSCGTTGTLRLNAARDFSLVRTATAPARRPMRDFQAALNLTGRGNRSGIDVYGDDSLDQSGSLTAALRQHGMSCGDRSHGPGLDVELDGLDRHIRVVLSAEQTDSEGFRTRCPGPAIDSATLASGVMALPPPLPRQFTVALTRSTSFEDSGYTLRTMPRLRLRLTRTRVTTAYYRMPTGP